MKKALIVATIGGFLPVSEMNNARVLQELGYEIHYVANMNNKIYEYDEKKLVEMGIMLHHIEFSKSPFHFTKLLKGIKAVRDIIDNEQIDVVHCHTPVGGVIGRVSAMMAKRIRPYVIYTAHGFHFYKGAPVLNWLLYYPVEYILSGITDCLVTINKEDYNRAQKMLCKKCVQIPGVGIDLNRFRPKERNISEKFRIISIGELNENKNHSVVIKAISALHDTDITYEIYGKGPLKDELEQLIQELRLEQQVSLKGFEIEIQKPLLDADCCIFPSFREGLGLAALEAMACGTPLIVSDNRGTREYAKHEINSIVCEADNVSQFAEAICRIKTDKAFVKKITENALQTVTKFSVEESTKVMRSVYETI